MNNKIVIGIIVATLIIIGAGLVAAAGSDFDTNNATTTPADTSTSTMTTDEQNVSGELSANNWQWERTEYSNGDIVNANDPEKFVLSFNPDEGRFAATTDCNNLMGQYEADENRLSFSKIASTLKACLGDSQEAEFKEMLSRVQGYLITNKGNLALTLEVDSGSVIFAPSEQTIQ